MPVQAQCVFQHVYRAVMTSTQVRSALIFTWLGFIHFPNICICSIIVPIWCHPDEIGIHFLIVYSKWKLSFHKTQNAFFLFWRTLPLMYDQELNPISSMEIVTLTVAPTWCHPIVINFLMQSAKMKTVISCCSKPKSGYFVVKNKKRRLAILSFSHKLTETLNIRHKSTFIVFYITFIVLLCFFVLHDAWQIWSLWTVTVCKRVIKK